MKLYGATKQAPNPRRVRIFAAEKGIALEEVQLDILNGGHRTPEHSARNSLTQVPVLELDDGTMLSETVAICRYLEALHPAPPLFGTSPKEIGLIEMWTRRAEFQLGAPLGSYWRHAHPMVAKLFKQEFKDFGESNVGVFRAKLQWLDREIGDGRAYLAGDGFSMADIAAVTLIDFAAMIGLDPLDGVPAVAAWHERVAARPSMGA